MLRDTALRAMPRSVLRVGLLKSGLAGIHSSLLISLFETWCSKKLLDGVVRHDIHGSGICFCSGLLSYF